MKIKCKSIELARGPKSELLTVYCQYDVGLKSFVLNSLSFNVALYQLKIINIAHFTPHITSSYIPHSIPSPNQE